MMLKDVWIGRVEVRQVPGEQLIVLSTGAAFTWFSCWAFDTLSFEVRAEKIPGNYGLFVVGVEGARRASHADDLSEALLEQIEETKVSEEYGLYGEFYTFPVRDN